MNMHLVLFGVALSPSTVGGNGETAAKESPRVLRLCELLDNWKVYNRKPVRVRAIYRVGAEQEWLSDPACPNEKYLTDVEFRPRTKGATKRLEQLVAKDRRAWVTFEGVFYGPETYKNVDPKLPASIREHLEKSPRRYGHMDSFESMIQVTRVVEAREVPADVSADHPIKSDPRNNDSKDRSTRTPTTH
jgi:hypothetical protein